MSAPAVLSDAALRTLVAEAERRRLPIPPEVRRRLRGEPAPAPSFLDFLALLSTEDQAAGSVRPWPVGEGWDPLWRDWDTLLHTQPLLFIGKTRRVMASNIACAWDLWVASGGSDPRWPTLTRGSGGRLVMIQSFKEQDEVGSQEFVRRIQMMERHSLRRIREAWPEYPDWRWSVGHGECSNGSRITAVASGDQFRGPGLTLLHVEELSRWPYRVAQETIGAALATLFAGGLGEAEAAGVGGHVVAIATPNVASYARDIRSGIAGRRGER